MRRLSQVQPAIGGNNIDGSNAANVVVKNIKVQAGMLGS